MASRAAKAGGRCGARYFFQLKVMTVPAAMLETAPEAVQRLQLGTASEYDPRVVDALSRVVHRRSLIQL